MIRSGGHRVRVVSRWLATPTLLLVAGFVAYANYSGGSLLLRIAGFTAMGAGVAGVVLFDTELIRARRSHAADRAALADSYAQTYAAHIRVTNPLPIGRERAEPTMRAHPARPAEPSDARPSSVPYPDAVSDTPSDAVGRPIPAVPRGPAVPPVPAVPAAELWPSLAEAPTVVDLIAWEERSRLSEATPAPVSDRKDPKVPGEPADQPAEPTDTPPPWVRASSA